ncbi:MAG: PilZ domain-containing protein [Sphingomicrobium sp.]
MSSKDEVAKRRTRIPVQMNAVLTDGAGNSYAVRVTDVSSAGFRLSSVSELAEGQQILLQVEDSPAVAARIQWVAGKEAGGMFLDPHVIL